MNYYDFAYGEKESGTTAVLDSNWTDEDEKKHPRNDKGEGGGQFKEKPETIEKQDSLSLQNKKVADDEAYLSAVKKGDTEAAMRMAVEWAKAKMPHTKVADEKGEPKIVWHGGNFGKDGNTVPDLEPGEMHFGTKEAALERVKYKYEGMEEEASIRPYFLNLENVKEIKDIGGERHDGEGQKWLDRESEEDKKYDGVRYVNESEDEGEESFAVSWNPCLIKLAETVTYDDDGKVIPLSKRFDFSNPDVRF